MVEKDAVAAERDKSTKAVELTLKMFGLVPWEFNLARETAGLIEEQAAAFYDPRKKRLFVLDTVPDGPEQRVALAHELAHALADQQYGLTKFLRGAHEDDASTARQSVVEGQASWLSWAVMAELAGGRAEVPAQLLQELSAVGATGEAFPVLGQTPVYMRESLTFPYIQGMQFQDAVFRKLGVGAFDRVFQNAPLSTSEILHPEGYGDALRRPQKVVLPKAPENTRKLIDGDLGEFDFSAILRQYVAEDAGRRAAAAWLGGAYALYEDKRSKAPLLVHASLWNSPASAQEFFQLYQDVLRSKWKQFEIRSRTAQEIRGVGDRGEFLLRISGASVLCLEGVSPP
jgi:hypothetical protein